MDSETTALALDTQCVQSVVEVRLDPSSVTQHADVEAQLPDALSSDEGSEDTTPRSTSDNCLRAVMRDIVRMLRIPSNEPTSQPDLRTVPAEMLEQAFPSQTLLEVKKLRPFSRRTPAP